MRESKGPAVVMNLEEELCQKWTSSVVIRKSMFKVPKQGQVIG